VQAHLGHRIGDTMDSKNFEFLRASHPELASLGGFVEAYAYPDPSSALVKLRTFVEQLVAGLYRDLALPRPYEAKLFDLLNQDSFKAIVPPVILSKLHQIRIQGNRAVHEHKASTPIALDLLKEAHDLARWFFLAHLRGTAAQCADYVAPSGVTPQTDAEHQRERRVILRKLASQETQMQELLRELEETRAKAQAAEKTAAEQATLLQTGRAAASALDFDEEATRTRFINVALAAVGWNTEDPDVVGQEVEVLHQPTATGKGLADYVLWGDNGRPWAVVEAKKTSVSAERGREQARYYADGFEKEYGFRPVIFYTNGYDIFLWNDARWNRAEQNGTGGEPPRKLFGFYSRDSLQYIIHQRGRKPLDTIPLNSDIAGRTYQLRCIKEVLERFEQKRRKSLLVMATGTGKTRVAISICDALLRAGWAKRILFLCDRKELRKQAKDAFTDHLPGEPLCIVKTRTGADRDRRIYLGTYPAMLRGYAHYDVGFFDVIIADESHRSIYNRYRDLFSYFDALQLGLTATPKTVISHNTYSMFDCEDGLPTSHYGFEEAIHDTPPSLVPFEVHTVTTKFLREGIGYWRNLDDQQKRQAEEQLGDQAGQLDADAAGIDKQVFNRDTNRVILRNLMEHGLRVGPDDRLGKTILFARSHKHAVLLEAIFNEEWPQYGGNFCRVIDNYDPRAQQLIDDFKGIGQHPDLTIAISVDMLDTGVDVPECANLVFAKPVKSYVKFWQMIGRGTRLSEDLLGRGRHKQKFLIFDHWKNFEYFDEGHREAENAPSKSLSQLVFEIRVELAEAALAAQRAPVFDAAVALLRADLLSLPENTVAVREKWREVRALCDGDALHRWYGPTPATLKHTIAPLMQWRDLRGDADAYGFDLLVTRMQKELVTGSARFADLKDELLGRVSELQINLAQVREKFPAIERVKRPEFWTDVTFADLEEIRQELRGIMKYRSRQVTRSEPVVVDVKEGEADIQRGRYQPKLEGLQLAAYHKEVREVLENLLAENATLQKIKRGQPVTQADLHGLVSFVLTQNPNVNLALLNEFYPKTAGHLDWAIRRIIGLDAEAVNTHFARFIQAHPSLTAKQVRFLEMVKNHIGKYGAIELERLYEAPFTTVDPESIDGVFPDATQADELLAILASFEPSAAPGHDPG